MGIETTYADRFMVHNALETVSVTFRIKAGVKCELGFNLWSPIPVMERTYFILV